MRVKQKREKEKKEARAKDAKAVDEAYEAYNKARNDYRAALNDFCKKHGAYHKTWTKKDLDDENISIDSFSGLYDLLKQMF